MRFSILKWKLVRRAGLLAVLWAVPTLCFGANHYVRQGASGNGSDWTNACADFSGSCAIGSLVRGDTYYVAAGTYLSGGANWSRGESGTSVITIKRATATDHGTDTGWNNSFDAPVTWGPRWLFNSGYWTFEGVTGRSVPFSEAQPYGFSMSDNGTSGSALIEINSGSNITISHIQLSGVSCCHGSFTGPYGVHGNGVGPNFVFSHSAVIEAKSDPIHLNGPGSGVIIDHVYIARNEGLLSTNHGQGIWLKDTSNATIRHSFFDDVAGTATIVCGGGGPCTNINIYGNVFYHSRTHPQSSNGNVSGDEVTFLVEGIATCNNLTFHNNTAVGFDSQHSGFYGGSTAGTVSMRNNLWFNINNSDIDLEGSQSHNTFLNIGASDSPSTGTNNFKTTSGSANPFVNMNDRNLRLAISTSALHLNDGLALPAPFNLDPDGNVRGTDGNWDRGAYESSTNVTRPNPPTNLQITTVQ